MVIGSSAQKKCQIVAVGKRRDGGTRYWCLSHHADATAKYGRRASECRCAHIVPPAPSEIVTIDTQYYPGGIALWGAVPPIYDTTNMPMERGIHVHARTVAAGDKVVDKTFRRVNVVHEGNAYPIDELDAIYFMVSSVFGYSVKAICCDKCGTLHLDKDWFSVHPHKVHLCAGCGKKFRDSEVGIGNPVGLVRDETGFTPPIYKPADREIEISQKDYLGGIQIWASNPAILWSSTNTPESGIHVHAFRSISGSEPEKDDTYSRVVIDGYELNEDHVRLYMAQSALPHILGRVLSFDCECGTQAFSTGEAAFTPVAGHQCHSCGKKIRPKSRYRKVIANPIADMFSKISQLAVRSPVKHDFQLLIEAP